MSKPLMIILAIAIAVAVTVGAATPPPAPASLEEAGVPGTGAKGSWLGALDLGAMKLRLALEITETDGKLDAVLDSIDQNAKVPVSHLEARADGLRFACASIGGMFEGQYSPDGAQLQGTWTQGGSSLPLTFKRRGQPFALKRPQEPQKPYPYRDEAVTIRNDQANITLAGTLTIPQGTGPFPAVVLMSGSGPQDRDESIMGHKPFLVLADHLTRVGIAVLRYDDRGVGGSTGNYGTSTHFDFAGDGRAAFEYLKTRKEVERKRIGLLGHSEGSVYAPYIVKEAADVAFVVMLAGVGVPMRELLERQAVDIARTSGVEYDPNGPDRALNDAIFTRLAQKKLDSETADFLRARMREAMALYPEETKKALGFNEDRIEIQVRMLMTPWFVELAGYDAPKELRHIRVPVLALFGGKDTQVAAEPNSSAMQATFAAAGNRDVTIKTFPQLNHLFQHATTGSPAEYSSIEETMAPQVLETTAQWILEKTK